MTVRERVDYMMARMPTPIPGYPVAVAVVCNGCGKVQPVITPFADPPGWMLGPLGADADYCPGCVQ